MRALFLLSLLSLPAGADGPWRFRAGETWIYECRSEFVYASDRTDKEGNEVTVHSPTTETLTLSARIEATGDDGSAKIRFEVTAASLESVWHDTGVRVTWDSRKDKSVMPGLVRYAALVGHRFEALVGPDGVIKELKKSEWPKDRDVAQSPDASLGEKRAAETTRDPTPARLWLDLIFATAPRAQARWAIRLVPRDAIEVEAAPDGRDRAGGMDCARTKFETPKRREGEREDVPAEKRLKGRSWFSAAAGATVKAEAEGREEAVRYREGAYGKIRWEVELKKKVEAGK